MEHDIQTLVTSPMRTGSTWVCEILQHVTGFPLGYINKEESEKISQHGICDLEGEIGKSHCLFPDCYRWLLGNNSKLHIIRIRRDIRDALASRFYYARYHANQSDLKLDPVYNDKMDDKDLVFHLALNSSILHNWYEDFKAFNFEVSHDRILDVTYENLLNGDDLRKICLFLGLDLMLFDASVKHNEFDRKQKIEKKRFKERGPKALFRRKGVVGEGSKLITAEVYELLAR